MEEGEGGKEMREGEGEGEAERGEQEKTRVGTSHPVLFVLKAVPLVRPVVSGACIASVVEQ